MDKQWREYYSRFPDIFMEKYLNIKLSPFKKLMIRLYNSRLDKFAISDMRKFYDSQSRVYMNMYFWSSIGSKYGYDRCKMAEEVVSNER